MFSDVNRIIEQETKDKLHQVDSLSGGQQQRLCIRGIAIRPEVTITR